MKSRIILLIMGAMFMLSAPVWAGSTPEFDAVGCDVSNTFANGNAIQFAGCIEMNQWDGKKLNLYSDFTKELITSPSSSYPVPIYKTRDYKEYFYQTAGQLGVDPCYGESYGNNLSADWGWDNRFKSALSDAWNEGEYEWSIVLQMKPQSDLNLSIYDCVLKHNEFNPYRAAEQTGRYRAAWGQLMFVPSANPVISVTAHPGKYRTPGFTDSFTMDARTLPGLQTMAMCEKLYTSKALWDESIVLALPETGASNAKGETTYNLKQGDRLVVKIQVPYNNTADIRYGEDSVMLKYLGIIGTYYYNSKRCSHRHGGICSDCDGEV